MPEDEMLVEVPNLIKTDRVFTEELKCQNCGHCEFTTPDGPWECSEWGIEFESGSEDPEDEKRDEFFACGCYCKKHTEYKNSRPKMTQYYICDKCSKQKHEDYITHKENGEIICKECTGQEESEVVELKEQLEEFKKEQKSLIILSALCNDFSVSDTEFRNHVRKWAIEDVTPPDPKALVKAKNIIYDLTGRKGLDGAWDSIDSDIQEEIIQKIAKIIRGE